ncbi:MAG: helix-turn-helix domain-containing protein [Oscillospiraceae bacterium]|nr:helix-turn-helix domain-containing protein [Oscillospiraceae bacterium]
MMQLSELKLVVASNLIKLRTGAGLTQAELGAKLNYSDKTISKWERGEAIPDAYVLTQLGEIFGVTVDDILSSHDAWQPIETEAAEEEHSYSTDMIIAIAVLGVWTLALTAFVALWIVDLIYWEIFIAALPLSVLVYLILICAFNKRRYLQYVIALFVLTIFIALFLLLPGHPWQLFLIAVFAEAIVFLSCNVQKRPRRRRKAAPKREE